MSYSTGYLTTTNESRGPSITEVRATLYVPVPLSDSFCGLPGALSLMKMSPDLVPAEVGVKVTCIVQKAPGCKVPRQLQVR